MTDAGATLGGRYVLGERIAGGGMGEVWRGRDSVLGRGVAVKLLLPALSGDPDLAARFLAEARAMARLSDPGIVEVYDYGQSDDRAYLVMQHVEGESLHHLLTRAGPLRPARAMSLVAQAGRALHVAHAHGIIHGDVKPGNLLVRTDGHVVLTDFGIARVAAADRTIDAGADFGTAAYLAPERVLGASPTPAADVYALGVVAYECLTTTRPFQAQTPQTVALMHTRDEPPPLPGQVPADIRDLVLRALAKDPARRWPSALALAEAAERIGPEPSGAPPPVTLRLEPAVVRPADLAGSIRSRHRATALVLVGLGLLLIVAATLIALRPSGTGAANERPADSTTTGPAITGPTSAVPGLTDRRDHGHGDGGGDGGSTSGRGDGSGGSG